MITYVDKSGETRRLGLIPTPPERRLAAARATIEPIPESNWREIDRRALFDRLNAWVYQFNCNGCVGFSAAEAFSKLRPLNGQPFELLSGAFIYSLINGGRDQGAMILDALDALETVGACLETSCPLDDAHRNIFRKNTKQHDAEAARFKLSKGYAVDSAAEAVAVLERGGILQFGVHVGGNFDPDEEGVIPFSRGPANHSVHGDGLRQTKSHGWCIDLANTWKGWGDKGRGLWPIEYLEETGYQEMFAHLGATDDPEDASEPPT